MADEIIDVEKTVKMKGRTTFAPGSPTPLWAIWGFRIEFVANKMYLMYLSGTSHAIDIKELLLYATIIDFGTWAIANMMGVKKKDIIPTDTE